MPFVVAVASLLLALVSATPKTSPPVVKPGFGPGVFESKLKGFVPYDKGGYPAFDPTRQTPLTPVLDPTLATQGVPPFNLLSIVGMALPFLLVLGLGALLLPLVFGLLGFGPSHGPFFPWSKRRSLSDPPLSKELILDLLTTVGEAIESVDARLHKAKPKSD